MNREWSHSLQKRDLDQVNKLNGQWRLFWLWLWSWLALVLDGVPDG